MILSKSKKTPEIFFFDEVKFIRATGEMKSFCNSANKILTILKENELEINPTFAEKALFASLDELAEIVMNEQRRRLNDMPDSAKEQLIINPNLNAIETIKKGMANMAAYNAGFIPGDYLQFAKGEFTVDEISLKEHFTICRNKQTDKIENLVNDFLRSWEKLKTYADEQSFDNVINVYGIVHFDPYSETFTFNKRSSDLKILVK